MLKQAIIAPTLPNNATRIILLITCIAEILTKIAKNLKQIRNVKKFLQDCALRKPEVHRAYISGIENGKRNPTLTTIQKLAEAFRASAGELLK